MPLKINVPDSGWSEQNISLNGVTYRFEFHFNGRDERWRMDIYLEDTPVIKGIKIMENQSLLGRYNLEDFDHGDIFCFRMEEDGNPVGRDNLGISKPYQLVYYSNDEILNS